MEGKAQMKAPEIAVRGYLYLEKPLMSQDKEVAKLRYDYELLSGYDLIACLDADRGNMGFEQASATQAFKLFAKAAAKCREENGGLDEQDLLRRMGQEDMLAAIKSGQVFFAVRCREAEMRIRKA